MTTTDNPSEKRTTHLPNGKFAPGNNANPSGRPKSKTMKEYAREWFLQLTDEQKTAYILNLEKIRPGFAWTMSEGNPHTTEDKTISIKVPTPILGGSSAATTLLADEVRQEITDGDSAATTDSGQTVNDVAPLDDEAL